MNFDVTDVFKAIATAAISILGWLMRMQHNKLERLERELSDHKVKSAEEYVNKNDLERLEDKIDRVLYKLDTKADKP